MNAGQNILEWNCSFLLKKSTLTCLLLYKFYIHALTTITIKTNVIF